MQNCLVLILGMTEKLMHVVCTSHIYHGSRFFRRSFAPTNCCFKLLYLNVVGDFVPGLGINIQVW